MSIRVCVFERNPWLQSGEMMESGSRDPSVREGNEEAVTRGVTVEGGGRRWPCKVGPGLHPR